MEFDNFLILPSNLTIESQEIMKSLAEIGMGYKRILFNDKPYLILNNEYAFEWNDYFSSSRFYALGIDDLIQEYGLNAPLNLNAVTLIPNPGSPAISPVGTYVPPPFIYTTQQGDIFYRLSSFPNDHCILSVSAFRSNSFAITANELGSVPSGLAAVGRYALPSRLPHIYIWELKPPGGTQVYVGTVIPNFGMSGGGVEVFFPNGFQGGNTKSIASIPIM